MPRPMTPTQFTVFTNASASAFKMSPRVTSIIVRDPWLVVPLRSDDDSRLAGRSSDGSLCLPANAIGDRAHRLDEIPGERAVHEELGLLGLLDCRASKVGGCHGIPIDLVQLGGVGSEARVPCACVRKGERPPLVVLASPGDDGMKVGLQVDDRRLTTAVGKVRVVRAGLLSS